MKEKALVAALVLASACSGGVPAPRIEGMSPSKGSSAAATPVTIEGNRYYLGVDGRIDASDATLDATFTADLDGVALATDAWVDVEHLTAVVPAGLPGGHHTLLVVTPLGMSASLREAFEVDDGTDTREAESTEPGTDDTH